MIHLIFFSKENRKSPTEKIYVRIDEDIIEVDNFFYLDIRFVFRKDALLV